MKKPSMGKQFLLLLTFLFIPFSVFAQTRTIEGSVTDAQTGEAIIGATVNIKGTTKGTITDMNGFFSLEDVTGEDILVISFVGYETMEIAVEDRTNFDVQLDLDLTELDEVVVVGYGVQKKDDLTGSVAVVDVDEMTKANYNTFDKALQGRAAGVHVMSTSGRPGQRAAIKIRGIGSISQDTEPLYVIDGMPVDKEAIVTLNSSDIESLQVLKDASATAIYGARGANGVILINTKRGESGKVSFNLDANTGWSVIPRQFDLMNAEEYTQLMEIAYDNFLERYPDKPNTFRNVYSDSARMANDNFNTDTDWQDVITRMGRTHNVNLSASGGTGTSNYYISGNYTEEEGILVGTAMDRFTLRGNSEFQITDNIKIGESLAVSRLNVNDEAHYGNGNPWLMASITSPYMPVYDKNALGGFGGPTDTLTGNNERSNPLAEQMLNDNNYFENRIMSSLYADIKFLESFTYTLKFGFNLYNTQRHQFSPKYTLGNLRLRDNDISKLSEINNYNRDYILTNMLTYDNSFGNHNLKLTGVYERSAENWKYNSAVGREISAPNLPVLDQAEEAFTVTGGEGDHRLESILARAIYDYRGKYLLTASLRRDGSTRFGPIGGRYGNFPSFSAGWKINEDFLTNVQEINMLKLRFGWGITGNENIRDYEYFSVIDPFRNSRYNFGADQTLHLGGAPTSYQANPLVKWEAAEMYNIGIDLNAFQNRLILTAEYYLKNQDDMLVRKAISVTFGKYVEYGGAGDVGAWVNLGRVQNKGLEFNATWRKMEGDFQYSINGNFATLKNIVRDIGANNSIETGYTITKVGNTIGSFYGHVAERILQEDDFLKDEEGNLVTDSNGYYTLLHAEQEQGTSPGDLKFKDVNQDGIINNLDRVIIGKSLPDFIYGLNFDASYRGFDFTLFLHGMQNMEVYSNHLSRIQLGTDRFGKDENKLADVLDDYWSPDNPSTTQTRITVVDENLNARVSSWFIRDASFLRVKSVQLGYTFPVKWMEPAGITSLRIFGNVNNLYTFTSYEGYDPEVGSDDPLEGGVDSGYYPVPRTSMVGFQLNF